MTSAGSNFWVTLTSTTNFNITPGDGGGGLWNMLWMKILCCDPSIGNLQRLGLLGNMFSYIYIQYAILQYAWQKKIKSTCCHFLCISHTKLKPVILVVGWEEGARLTLQWTCTVVSVEDTQSAPCTVSQLTHKQIQAGICQFYANLQSYKEVQ